jgi:hypothetical protein
MVYTLNYVSASIVEFVHTGLNSILTMPRSEWENMGMPTRFDANFYS